MRTRLHAIILILLFMSASCGRNKGMFILHGTVQPGTDSILVIGLDSRFEDIDTIFCRNGQFTWKFRPDTVTTLILLLPDGRHHPVFAEKDVESFITVPADTGFIHVSGGYCNDSYQSFYMESSGDTAMSQTAARIDSFITRDPFSEVTPYLIYDCMVQKYHARENDIEALIKRMSGNMQDAPYLTQLKLEFNRNITNNIYLDRYSVNDSTGHSYQFVDIGGRANHLLVCVWASWMGEKGLEARDTLQYFLNKYYARNFNVTDISIDVNTERWKETISGDTVRWVSYNDPEGWESRLIKNANLQSAPAFVLFSGAKKILFKATSIQALDNELDRTLPKPREESKSKTITRTEPKADTKVESKPNSKTEPKKLRIKID